MSAGRTSSPLSPRRARPRPLLPSGRRPGDAGLLYVALGVVAPAPALLPVAAFLRLAALPLPLPAAPSLPPATPFAALPFAASHFSQSWSMAAFIKKASNIGAGPLIVMLTEV